MESDNTDNMGNSNGVQVEMQPRNVGWVDHNDGEVKVIERGWLSTVWTQWLLLMKKNGLLTWRAKSLALFQLIAPILFMLILYAVQSYVNGAIQSDPYSKPILSPQQFQINNIPRCFPPANQPNTQCYTLMYSPYSLISEMLVNRVALQNNIPNAEIIHFDNNDAMDDFILANPNVTQAGYKFLSLENGTYEYSIIYNQTFICLPGVTASCKITAEDIALPMSVFMDKEIIRHQQQLDGNPQSDSLEVSWYKMQFPQRQSEYQTIIVPIFLLATVMFNFVILAKTMVVEKETRLKEGLRMMGMLELPYWMSWFAYYTIVMLVTVLMLFVAGYIFSFTLFTKNDFWLVFFMLFLFGECMICLAFLLVALQSRSSSTATIGFIIWVVVCAVFITINTDLYTDDVAAIAQELVSLIAPFAFSKGISDLDTYGYRGGINWDQRDKHIISTIWTIEKVYQYIVLDAFIYLVLAWYITNVFPGEFGVPKPFYFFLTPSYWVGSSGKNTCAPNAQTNKHLPPIDDEDVLAEDNVVSSGSLPLDTAVVLRNLVKVYGSGKKKFMAVKGVSLTMQNNQLFCLLGPNGAGKTTTFSMLTGLFPSSGGDATIFGHSINTEMDKIRKLMGVCPQHDLLWNDLTGRQHLEFFCHFKNVPSHLIKQEVKNKLEEVGLTRIADVPTSAYSGGEKRRLSVALATTGDPKIVFLDEPTTGMDPVSRHQVWEIISNAKRGRVVILTTHSMEEADRLSDRIGIVAHGQLRCLGTNIHLKNKFGLGYQLNIFFAPARHEELTVGIKNFIRDQLPKWNEHSTSATSLTPGNMCISIPHSDADELPDLLRVLEDNSKILEIDELALNLSSLEEVFLKIAGESLNETSISMNDLDNADQELAELVKDQSVHDGETPYHKQMSAVFLKNWHHIKHSWKGLLYQFVIPLLLVVVMIAMGLPSYDDIKDNPHPVNLPPLFYRLQPLPKLDIPYYVPSGVDLGECCGVASGFLGNVDFSILNSTETDAINIGMFVPTQGFTFQQYNDKTQMYQYLLDTNSKQSGYITGYTFDDVDVSQNRYRIGVLRNISEPLSTIGWTNLISNAILRSATTGGVSLTVRTAVFPTKAHEKYVFAGSIEATWVVLGGSFFMVSILSYIVKEKEEKLRYLMQMAGMRMSVYWLILGSIYLALYWVFMLFFYGLSAAVQLAFFTTNAPTVLIVNYFVFAFNQVGMAFFISTFSSSAHSISLAIYMYIVALVVATGYINPVFADEGYGTSDSILYGTAVIPHIAFGRVISVMVYYFYPELQGVTWDLMVSQPHFYMMFVIMFGVGAGFFILHQYFERIFPTEFGTTMSPIFFLLPSWWNRVLGKKDTTVYEISAPAHEPEDCAAERKAAGSMDVPLRVPGITKIFKGSAGTKIAVNNLQLTVGKCECVGLLGPNGGGKSTFISVLSGLYPASQGAAYVNGHNIRNQLIEAQRYIGVCPQDSVLFLEMTGREHLQLFGRLRNLQGEQLERSIDLALKQVLLTDAQHRHAGGYSGGMKRRLSLAIALIGNPKVVMLDEPTTGVDPFSRRVVWDVIQSYKKYCSIVLITHSMEEAEVLCDRVCMVSEGEARCIGRPVELKTRYGVGYTLTILHQNPSPEDINQFIQSIVPTSNVLEIMANTCVFSLPKGAVRLSELFSAIQSKKSHFKITDWGLLQSNLEDVLLKATSPKSGAQTHR